MHELLEEHFKGVPTFDLYPASLDERTELECQSMFAAYRAHYPVEPFDVVDVERTFRLPIDGTAHSYTGKFDGIVRYPDDQIAILEHKTEKRSALKNLPEAWAARSQVSLYMWAAKQLYGKWPTHIVLDVLRRQSDKGQEPCTFYRDHLERTEAQATEALQDLVYIADQIAHLQVSRPRVPGDWPRSTDQCVTNRWKCDYFSLCHIGCTDELLQIQFKPAVEYLQL